MFRALFPLALIALLAAGCSSDPGGVKPKLDTKSTAKRDKGTTTGPDLGMSPDMPMTPGDIGTKPGDSKLPAKDAPKPADGPKATDGKKSDVKSDVTPSDSAPAVPCGKIDEIGCCAGTVLKYCDTSTNTLEVSDCAPDTCGWDGDSEWYDCGFTGADPAGKSPIACP